jgi:hypothetical protein
MRKRERERESRAGQDRRTVDHVDDFEFLLVQGVGRGGAAIVDNLPPAQPARIVKI